MLGNGKLFLKIGTHQIGKLDIGRGLSAEGQNESANQPKSKIIAFKKALKKEKRMSAKNTASFLEESASVLVLEKKPLTRTD